MYTIQCAHTGAVIVGDSVLNFKANHISLQWKCIHILLSFLLLSMVVQIYIKKIYFVSNIRKLFLNWTYNLIRYRFVQKSERILSYYFVQKYKYEITMHLHAYRTLSVHKHPARSFRRLSFLHLKMVREDKKIFESILLMVMKAT